MFLLAMLFYQVSFCFLISAVIAKTFTVIAELAIPTAIPTEETRTEIETNPATLKAWISKSSV